MKKESTNRKISGPSKLLRRVLSRSSTTSSTSHKSKDTEKMPVNLEYEINSLKEQIGKLQFIVNNLHNDTERKDEAIANLSREKEKLTCDLNKELRTNKKLKQQLDDEREFYYREKESYCKEMNECKKMKKNMQDSKNEVDRVREVENLKKEAAKMKELLQQTLETNYNLSVKFLRMKNTKYSLKNRFKVLQTTHNKLKVECQNKIGLLKNELSDLINTKLNSVIHPSNKRYLQIIKQNGNLVHENMCLQLEVDRLNLEVQRLKMQDLRKETNSKLKYINVKFKENGTTAKEFNDHLRNDIPTSSKKEHAIDGNYSKDEVTSKTDAKARDLYPREGNEKYFEDSCEEVKKIYERKKVTGTPRISMIHEIIDEKPKKHKGHKKKPELIVETPRPIFDKDSLGTVNTGLEPSNGSTCTKTQMDSKDSKSDLSEYSYYPQSEAVRTQSAPEIVQSSSFVNQT